MVEKTIKVVITGAESTGKSLLSEALANHFNVLWVPEYSRTYIENLGRHYTYDDVKIIARHQIAEEQKITGKEKLVFFDTWLLITKVWMEFVYGKSPDWLDYYISNSSVALFLLCDTDIPWEPDPVRENGGESREILQRLYVEQLEKYGFSYKLISGLGELRTERAIETVDDYLKRNGEKVK
jgi:NadR type nicotinamide-nucleotide adenylyltransferase